MDIDTQKKIAEIIKSWVENSIYSQIQLSRILGISQPVLNLQLNGKNPFPVSRIKELVEILNPSVDDMEVISSLILGTSPTGADSDIPNQIKNMAKLKHRPKENKEEAYQRIMDKRRALSQVFAWAELDSDRCAALLSFIESTGSKLPKPSICMSTDLIDIIWSHPFLDIKEKDKAIWNVEWYKKTEALWKHFQNVYEGTRRQIFDTLSFLEPNEQEFVLAMINRLRLPREKAKHDAMLAALYKNSDSVDGNLPPEDESSKE